MRYWNKLLVLGFGALLLSCGGSEEESDETQEVETIYGGVFKMPIGSYFSTIEPVNVHKLETAQVYDQIFERLVKYNPRTLEIESELAEEWTVSEDLMSYTFKLKDEVYFHDNSCFPDGKGRKVSPEDIVYTFEKIYTQTAENKGYYTFQNTISGGEAFYNGEAESIEGITVNGNEITFKIEKPSTVFLQKMATVFASVVPKEAYETDVFTPVGTGPFMYSGEKSSSEYVLLQRNSNYHLSDDEGNQLPYLDSVVFQYYENPEESMDLFWDGNMTYIPNVPITKINHVLEERISDFESDPPKYKLVSEPQISTTYLEFNMESPVFKKKKVRQAINHAINRKKLVEKIMKNQAYDIGRFGITPPVRKIFKDYDFEGIEAKGYVYDPELAQKELAEAGYPDGKGFPSIEFQVRLGNDQYLVASEIQNQLRSVLNINVNIEAVEFNQLIENQANGTADMFRSTWFGDYPNPETFLVNAYGGVVPKDKSKPSYINSSRFVNKDFDKYFEAASNSSTIEEAYENYAQAEKILMEEAPLIILWYGEDMMLIQADVHGLETNGMRYLDLRRVYFQALKPSSAASEDDAENNEH